MPRCLWKSTIRAMRIERYAARASSSRKELRKSSLGRLLGGGPSRRLLHERNRYITISINTPYLQTQRGFGPNLARTHLLPVVVQLMQRGDEVITARKGAESVNRPFRRYVRDLSGA